MISQSKFLESLIIDVHVNERSLDRIKEKHEQIEIVVFALSLLVNNRDGNGPGWPAGRAESF